MPSQTADETAAEPFPEASPDMIPAYPVRAACEHLKDPGLQGQALINAMLQAIEELSPGITNDCLKITTTADNSTFGYQLCAQDTTVKSFDGGQASMLLLMQMLAFLWTCFYAYMFRRSRSPCIHVY